MQWRDHCLAPPAGFEPAANGIEVRCSVRTELRGLIYFLCFKGYRHR